MCIFEIGWHEVVIPQRENTWYEYWFIELLSAQCLRKEKKFVDVEKVKLPENTLLKLYNFPSAGVIVELTKENEFRALGYKHLNAIYMKGSDFVERGRFHKIRDEIVKNHKGETVVIYRMMNSMLPWYQDYMISVNKELDGKYCRRLENNLDKGLCICVPENKKDEILIAKYDDELSCEDKTIKIKNNFIKKLNKIMSNKGAL